MTPDRLELISGRVKVTNGASGSVELEVRLPKPFLEDPFHRHVFADQFDIDREVTDPSVSADIALHRQIPDE